ncbi:hypothetical protein [Paraburkholderia sediminicola]|uniref:hypothetical protein n=1 Tax=Paraburkholderia sediminicola TaxID=458836 RepID=UPI0038B946AD
MGWLRNSQEGNDDEETFEQASDPSELPPDDPAPEASAARSNASGTGIPDLHVPAELHLLRDLLATNDWTQKGAAAQVQWTMIESEIRNALDARMAREVRDLWGRFAPKDHPGLDGIIADRARVSQNRDPEQRARVAAGGAVASETFGTGPGAGAGFAGAAAAAGFAASQSTAAAPADPLKPIFQDFIDVESREIPNVAFSDPYKSPNWPKDWPRPLRHDVPDTASAAPAQTPQAPGQMGTTSLLSQAISLPLGMMGGAGSLVANSLKALGGTAKSFYVKNRINGFHVLGGQLEDSAERISTLTGGLRKDGFGDLLDRMKATGRPAKEVFEGMRPGGAYQEFAKQFDGLMANKSFAQRYDELLKEVQSFGLKAGRYANTGMELNEDVSDVIDRTVQRVSEATEGFPSKIGEAFEHLQDVVRDIGERIAKMVSRMLGRLRPAAA